MEDFIDRRTRGFSRGQQMKVALGRALVHQPHNIMLDEPTNGLDVGTSRAVRDLLRRFRGEGRCVLLTSHIMQEVAALADRIMLLAGGRIALRGTPGRIAPRDRACRTLKRFSWRRPRGPPRRAGARRRTMTMLAILTYSARRCAITCATGAASSWR